MRDLILFECEEEIFKRGKIVRFSNRTDHPGNPYQLEDLGFRQRLYVLFHILEIGFRCTKNWRTGRQLEQFGAF